MSTLPDDSGADAVNPPEVAKDPPATTNAQAESLSQQVWAGVQSLFNPTTAADQKQKCG